jgi:hypothetical protein
MMLFGNNSIWGQNAGPRLGNAQGVGYAVLLFVNPSNGDELVVEAEHGTIPAVSNRELALSRWAYLMLLFWVIGKVY